MKTFLNGRLTVQTGDITEMAFDGIVNAANTSLMGGGGVDGAIHRKGGPNILEECRRIRQERYPHGLPPGRAVITTGGNLPSRFVIHTVGPIWKDGKSGEQAILAEAYKNSLSLASENGLRSLAFPAISTGVYGFPKETAAPIVYETIQAFVSQNSLPEEIHLVFFSSRDMDTFINAL